MDLKLKLNDFETESFMKAKDEYSAIVNRKVSNTEFATFAMFWFINGFLRDDVDDSAEDAIKCHP